MLRICLVLLALSVFTAAGGAQLIAGDYVVPVNASNALFAVTPQGAVTTIMSGPLPGQAVCMAGNNRDLLVIGQTGGQAILCLVQMGGPVVTLARLSTTYMDNIAIEPDGSFLVPLGYGQAVQVARVTAQGVVTLVNPAPSVNGIPRGIAVDIGTGRPLLRVNNALVRIRPDATWKSITGGLSAANARGDMESDARNTNAIVAQQASLVSVNTSTGAITTIAGGLTGCFPALTYDRAYDGWVLGSDCTTGGNIYKVNRAGKVTTLVAFPGANDICVYGSRNIVATADPVPGQPFNLTFSDPANPGATYLAAASFGSTGGIDLPAGRVDLTVDDLFILSQVAPGMFVNFRGILDVNGNAAGQVVLPNISALSGQRFYVSFVSVYRTSVAYIANTQGFTIQ